MQHGMTPCPVCKQESYYDGIFLCNFCGYQPDIINEKNKLTTKMNAVKVCPDCGEKSQSSATCTNCGIIP